MDNVRNDSVPDAAPHAHPVARWTSVVEEGRRRLVMTWSMPAPVVTAVPSLTPHRTAVTTAA